MTALNRNLKIVLSVLTIAGASCYIYLAISRPLAVSTIVLVPQEARLTFTEQGVAEYEDRVYVYPHITGKLLDINVTEGQTVKKGDVICKIDMSDVSFAIDEANAQILSLEAQIRNLDSERQRINDDLIAQKNNLSKELQKLNAQENSEKTTADQKQDAQNQQIELQNIVISQNLSDIVRMEAEFNNTTQKLYENGQLPRKDYEAALDGINKVKAQYEQNLQQLEIIKAGQVTADPAYYNAMRAAVQEQINGINESLSKDYTMSMKEYYNAQIDSIYINIERLKHSAVNAEVTSTIDGVIIDLPVSKSNMASSAAYLAEIAVGRLLVSVYVSTNDINTINVGDPVDLILRRRGGDEIYEGRVAKIDNKAEVKISSLGVEERKVGVYAEPASHCEVFQQGYDVDVRFLVYSKENALVLPRTAVFKDGDTERVWEVFNGKLRKTDVITGMELINNVIIDSGLLEGAVVVSDSTLKELREGAGVIIK